MSLKIHDRIYISTHNGEREIQLCLGDITKLPKDEAVDVILVSSYPGDYIPMRGTLIGALRYNLGLSVYDLAKYHKKEDLRKNFSCWISEALPARLPFRQLMCFERNAMKAPDIFGAVEDMFRAMQPVFNNQTKTVITPLLATGCQGVEHQKMLLEMVKSAVMWMRLGLPLQTLKIVIYSTMTIDYTTKMCLEAFKLLKKKLEHQHHVLKEPEVKRDIFLVYNDDDKEVADKLTEYLKKEKPAVQITSLQDVETKASSWYHDVYTAMMECAKIVPLLSGSFLSNEQCVDQYNVALCCNRFMSSRRLLAPVCLDRLALPTYMGMVQWINCRGRENEKLETAATILVDQLVSVSQSNKQSRSYDVFISYAHKDSAQAKCFLALLQAKNASIKIFFDYDELKSGVDWQRTLYDSIDGCRCFIALVSDNYQVSDVCNEEFNLALARHHAKGNDTKLVIVTLDETDTSAPAYNGLTVVKTHGKEPTQAFTVMLDPILNWLKSNTDVSNFFSDTTDLLDLGKLAETERKRQFSNFYEIDGPEAAVKLKDISCESPKDASTHKLFLSFSLRDQAYVHVVTSLLRDRYPTLAMSDKLSDSPLELDSATHYVIFLSMHYRKSPKQMEEFNMILSKMRGGSAHVYVITLSAMPLIPTYLNLVPSYTSLVDEFWEDVLPVGQGREIVGDVMYNKMLQQAAECQKLYQTDVAMRELLALYKSVTDVSAILFGTSNRFYETVGYPRGVFVNVQLLQHRHLQSSDQQKKQVEIVLGEHADNDDVTAAKVNVESIGGVKATGQVLPATNNSDAPMSGDPPKNCDLNAIVTLSNATASEAALGVANDCVTKPVVDATAEAAGPSGPQNEHADATGDRKSADVGAHQTTRVSAPHTEIDAENSDSLAPLVHKQQETERLRNRHFAAARPIKTSAMCDIL